MNDDTQWARIERRIDGAPSEVWSMWTDPNKFASWYGPNGMTIPVAEMDLSLGGKRKICMEMVTPERTMTMWFTGEFTGIDAPSRLSYTEAMCDADGNIIPPSAMGMPEGTPEMTEVVVELSEDGDGTKMTVTHIGVPAGSPGEGGWSQAIEKLAAKFA